MSIETYYAEFVATLVKPGEEIDQQMTPRTAHLLHMALGICGEAGELADAIKKATIYGKPLDLENVKEELGDLEWFMEALRQSLDITRQDTIAGNITKLRKRYWQSKFSNEQAAARADKAGGAQ